ADLDLKSSTKSEQEALVERLTKTIELRTAGSNNLYSIAYRDTEPDKAKRVVQSMVSIFVESGLGASRKDTDSAKSFLAEQIKSYETKLEEAETRLKEFRLRNMAAQGADGKDAASRIAETAQQLEAARLQLKEAENARDAARQQLAAERGQGGAGSLATQSLLQESSISVATPELDSRIDNLKRNLDGLQQRYTDKHPDVISSRKLLQELEEQKKKEVKELRRLALASAASGGSGANTSMAAQELSRIVAASEVQVASLQARVAEYASRYNAAREAMKFAPQIESEAAQLNRDYAINKKNYEDLVARRQSAVMSGELDVASGVAEFRLIDPPRVSPKPVSPNRLALFSLVLAASLAAGLAFTFVASQVRPTFSHGDELRLKTGLPLLGVVTMLASDSDRRRDRLALFRFVAASGGLVALFLAGLIAMSLMSRYGV
ncbi:MAG TPA: XrtA system polysaccharide chain length determinant, partial [Rubrivivax sp.]|nr:XrtA system polysaccharide chain length determinant [Rubrivivax sp.]